MTSRPIHTALSAASAAYPADPHPHANGRPLALPLPWARLCAAYGGLGKLALLLDVSPMTVWRWTRGTTPKPEAARTLAKLAKKKKIPNPTEAEL